MADIDIERKSGGLGWLWWLLGLLLLALLAWWLLSGDDEREVAIVDPVAAPAVVEPAPMATDPVAATTPTIADVLANPGTYAGQSFSTGQVRVAEVISDRGFWIENNGQRMFVVKNESPVPGVADTQGAADTRPGRNVNAGDMLQINGTVMTSVDGVQPPLDDDARQVIQAQPAFLQANVADIQHMDGAGAMNAGATTPPATTP